MFRRIEGRRIRSIQIATTVSTCTRIEGRWIQSIRHLTLRRHKGGNITVIPTCLRRRGRRCITTIRIITIVVATTSISISWVSIWSITITTTRTSVGIMTRIGRNLTTRSTISLTGRRCCSILTSCLLPSPARELIPSRSLMISTPTTTVSLRSTSGKGGGIRSRKIIHGTRRTSWLIRRILMLSIVTTSRNTSIVGRGRWSTE
mmetsp:Transcript_3785/g.6444  ORF Transcript_3785/g.6444 Transcript_3785/m.6444 type:complete len:204 (-) Transcript_3785:926-1537(-)